VVSVRPSRVLLWVVYGLGVIAAALFVLSAAVAGVVYLSLDEQEAFYLDVSTPAVLVWSGLVVMAAATWFWRRRRVRR